MKKVQITLGMLNNSRATLGKLLNAEFPVMLAYKLSKMERELSSHLEAFQKVINPIIVKYGKKLPNGSFQLLPEMENYNLLVQKHNELSVEKLIVEVPEINMEDIINDKNLKLSSNDILILDWLFNPDVYAVNNEVKLEKI
jgi:hypothetical protein